MRLERKRLSLKRLLLIVVPSIVFISCEDSPDMTPHFVDVDLQECREYEIIDKKAMIIKKKKDWPIDHCNGFFAIPADQARAWKEYYIKKREQKSCQTQPSSNLEIFQK
jgi:hypothetical protein